MEYFAIFYAIGFSFRAHDTKLFRVGLASRFEELRPADDLRADEAALEVGVDRTGRLLGGRAARNCPCADLVVADREEGAEPEELVRCDRKLLERLKVLDENELAVKTKHYLNKDEVKALMARRDKIVAHFQQLIAKKGENDVLY